MNLGLLSLQEKGTLREMQHTWWKEKHGGGACKVRLLRHISKHHVHSRGQS